MLTLQDLITIKHALGFYPDQIRKFLALCGDGTDEESVTLAKVIADTQSAMEKIDKMIDQA